MSLLALNTCFQSATTCLLATQMGSCIEPMNTNSGGPSITDTWTPVIDQGLAVSHQPTSLRLMASNSGCLISIQEPDKVETPRYTNEDVVIISVIILYFSIFALGTWSGIRSYRNAEKGKQSNDSGEGIAMGWSKPPLSTDDHGQPVATASDPAEDDLKT